MPQVLVTGGAGFIGSHLVERLLRDGHSVRVLDNLSTGNLKNIQHLMADVELLQGDIRDEDIVRKAVRAVQWVFHEAALPSVPRSIEDPVTSVSVNVMGTVTLLKAAVDAGVQRVIYAASSSAYGDARSRKQSETLVPMALSPYAAGKLAGEYLLEAFATCYAVETVGLRYFNVFGERQNPDSPYAGVIARFCQLMRSHQTPIIYGDGTAARDFVHVRNVVEANLLAATTSPENTGAVYNIASGDSYTLLELVAQLNRIIGSNLTPLFEPERPGDIKFSCADITKAQTQLGYTPTIDFAEGLRRTVDWYHNQTEPARTGKERLA